MGSNLGRGLFRIPKMKLVFIVPGIRRGERMVEVFKTLASGLPSEWDLWLVTNAENFPGFPAFATNLEELIKIRDEEAQRAAKIADLTLRVSGLIAKQMIDGKDDILTFLVVEDKIAAVIRIPFSSGQTARKSAGEIKKGMEQFLMGVIN